MPAASHASFSVAHCSSVERRALEVLPARLALEVRRRGRVARRLGRGVVELELDGVGAALGGDLREPDRVAEAAVVVHAGLGDDVHPLHAAIVAVRCHAAAGGTVRSPADDGLRARVLRQPRVGVAGAGVPRRIRCPRSTASATSASRDDRGVAGAVPAGGSLVDLGCGGGQLCLHSSRLGWKVTGVDVAGG